MTSIDRDTNPYSFSIMSNVVQVTAGYATIFSDSFDGSTTSSNFYVPTWTSGNRFAVNNKDACSQGGGKLKLSVKKVGDQHHACYLISHQTFGPGSDSTIKIEYKADVSNVRAKGAWAAGWMYALGKNSQGVDYAADGIASTGSEYDVFEYSPAWNTAYNSAVHDGRSDDPSKWTDGKGVQTGTHTYTLEWNKQCQVYSVDGVRQFKVTNPKFISQNTNHHIMLTMEAQTGTDPLTGQPVGNFADNLTKNPALATFDSVTVAKKTSIDANLCNG